jgi:hypothetical protein
MAHFPKKKNEPPILAFISRSEKFGWTSASVESFLAQVIFLNIILF